MQLIRIIIQKYLAVFSLLIILNISSAILSIAVIAFINAKLTSVSGDHLAILMQFSLLLLLLLTVRFVTQFGLTFIGHTFVYNFRNTFVKNIMATDIETIEKLGSAKLLASLSKDIEKIQIAFMRLPEFMQGSILCIAVIGYLSYLSFDILLVVLAIIIFVALVAMIMVKKVYSYYKTVRDLEDNIYADYQAIIDGRKELALNKLRSQYIYQERLDKHSAQIKSNIIYGDSYHLTALNWANVMLLGCIGIVFYLANVLSWADNSVATVFAVTLLFLQSPLVQTIGAIPAFFNAQVSFEHINALQLREQDTQQPIANTDENANLPLDLDWQSIELKQLCYAYHNKQGKQTFQIGAIDFRLQRGELVFLIGGNGSGKSTFAKLLTGLYLAHSGEIMVDNHRVTKENHQQYRQMFSAVFTDLHLFKKVIGSTQYQLSDDEHHTMHTWLNFLQMHDKLTFDDNQQLLNDNLSQGQRKRFAMLLSVLEGKDIILLDEWAADQDPQYRHIFYHELLPKLQAMGKTLIVISHDNHYFEHADRLLQMKDRQLIELTGKEREIASQDAIVAIS